MLYVFSSFILLSPYSIFHTKYDIITLSIYEFQWKCTGLGVLSLTKKKKEKKEKENTHGCFAMLIVITHLV